MRVKVINMQDPEFWYEQEVGNEFNVLELKDDPDYLILDGKHEGKFLHRDDCIEIVEPEEVYEPLKDEEEEENES